MSTISAVGGLQWYGLMRLADNDGDGDDAKVPSGSSEAAGGQTSSASSQLLLQSGMARSVSSPGSGTLLDLVA